MKQPVHPYFYRAMLRRLLIAMMLGVASAVIVWLFHRAMLGLEWLMFARTDGSLVAAASSIDGWQRAVVPAFGGMVAGSLLWIFQRCRHQRPAAPTDYMEAIETGDGRLDLSASLVKSLASLLVVSSGSAIGREGAMVLLAALFARFLPSVMPKPASGNCGLPVVPRLVWPVLIMHRWRAACLSLKFCLVL